METKRRVDALQRFIDPEAVVEAAEVGARGRSGRRGTSVYSACNRGLDALLPKGPMTTTAPYLAPGWFDRQVFNRLVTWLARRGISIWGSRVLEVTGRRSGKPQRVPVNLLTFEGADYLVAPRGQTQWVRNLRAQGGGHLILGRKRSPFVALEVADDAKEALLRAYLERWQFEVGRFFAGVTHDAPASELQRIAPNHPVFKIALEPG